MAMAVELNNGLISPHLKNNTALLTIPGLAHEVSFHLLFVWPIFVFDQEPVAAIVEVRGTVQLQAAVVFPVCDVVNLSLDEWPLRHCFIVQKPLQLWLRVSWGKVMKTIQEIEWLSLSSFFLLQILFAPLAIAVIAKCYDTIPDLD